MWTCFIENLETFASLSSFFPRNMSLCVGYTQTLSQITSCSSTKVQHKLELSSIINLKGKKGPDVHQETEISLHTPHLLIHITTFTLSISREAFVVA